MKKKNILITGASSGIGRSMAIALASADHHLFLIARREERLKELEKEILKLNPYVSITLIIADVNSSEISQKITEATDSRVDILINNAGLALGREKVQDSAFNEWEQMIQTNVVSAFKICHLVVPWMLSNGGGDIINLCSIAGHYNYSGGAVYCATKHAVKAFTRILREETCGKNIRVMQISPGMVDTEFSTVRFKGDEKLAKSVYAGMTPLTADDIARMMKFMLDQPRHVVIDEIITMPTDQGSPTTVSRKNS